VKKLRKKAKAERKRIKALKKQAARVVEQLP
jgi:hypothetical protein